jgi:UDP-glucose 4-epimerase
MLADTHILVTGGNGYVGQHLCQALLQRGARVSKIVRSSLSVPGLPAAQYTLDLTERDKVDAVFAKLEPDYVIHLAGSKNRINDVTKYSDSYNDNVTMSLNVIHACRSLVGFKRMIFLGTCDEYGHAPAPYSESQKTVPTGAYGLSKLAVTQILCGLFHSHQFPSVVLRPSVIYGPGQGKEMFLSALIQSLLAGNDFPMTAGEQRRDFVYIHDVIEAIVKVIEAGEHVNGELINIGAGVSHRVRDVAYKVADLIAPDSRRLIQLGAVEYRRSEVMEYSLVIDHAKEMLNWYPRTNLEEGLHQTIKHFKEHD